MRLLTQLLPLCALLALPRPADGARGSALDRAEAFIGYKERDGSALGSAADCADRNERCADWAAHGECEQNAGFMRTECAHSCAACSPPALGPAAPLGADEAVPTDILVLNTSVGAIRIAVRPPDVQRVPVLQS